MPKSDQPIIVKRIKKGDAHGSHGAWKVAYADFVTAMMAFFLLLWLLNAVTQEQLEGVSNYFAPASIARTVSGSGDVFGGTAVAVAVGGGAKPTAPTVSLELPPPKATPAPEAATQKEVNAEDAEELVKKREQDQFEKAAQEIKETLEKQPQLRQLAQSLVIDNTPEGLRIQIVDQEGLAMFPRGSPDMYLHTRKALEMVAKVVQKLPQNVMIAGHTDATKFAGGEKGYTNWELSADRANATRRALIEYGVPVERLARVVGAADQDPFLANDPANPRNRRIAIVLLRGTGEKKP